MAEKLAAIACCVLALGSVAARGDVLLLDGIEQDAQTAAQRPKAGMSMTKVEAQYGESTEKHAAVGEPPITRWDYPDFSVYFEHDRVIHAVAKHQQS